MCSQAFDLAFVDSSGVHAAEGFVLRQRWNIEASLQLLLQRSRSSVTNKKVLLTSKNVKVVQLAVLLLFFFPENFVCFF